MTNVIQIEPYSEKQRQTLLVNKLLELGADDIIRQALTGSLKTIVSSIDLEKNPDLKILSTLIDMLSEDITVDGFTEGYIEGFLDSITHLSIRVEKIGLNKDK